MEPKIRMEHELLAVQGEHAVHAMLELTAPPPRGEERAPLDLALVVDRSGSMAGPKLETTKACAQFLVRRLGADDRLSLVTYDDQVDVLRALLPVDRPALEARIADIDGGGSTNLSGGWLKGMETLRAGRRDGVRRVLLLTDGLANVGITDPGALVSMAAGAAGDGIATTTIGFGDGFDEDLLTRMADAGRGSAHYAATPDEAPGIFAEEFEGLTAVVAQNVSIEIRPSPDVRLLGVLNEHPITTVEGGVQVQLGDAYGDERRRVVFELQIPHLAALGVVTVAEIVLRYVAVGDEVSMREVTLPVVVNAVSADEAAAAEPDREVVEEVVVLRAAKAQLEARRLADAGDVDGARRGLALAVADLRRVAPASSAAEDLEAMADEIEQTREVLAAPAAYTAGVRKEMTYRSDRMRKRRPPR